ARTVSLTCTDYGRRLRDPQHLTVMWRHFGIVWCIVSHKGDFGWGQRVRKFLRSAGTGLAATTARVDLGLRVPEAAPAAAAGIEAAGIEEGRPGPSAVLDQTAGALVHAAGHRGRARFHGRPDNGAGWPDPRQS